MSGLPIVHTFERGTVLPPWRGEPLLLLPDAVDVLGRKLFPEDWPRDWRHDWPACAHLETDVLDHVDPWPAMLEAVAWVLASGPTLGVIRLVATYDGPPGVLPWPLTERRTAELADVDGSFRDAMTGNPGLSVALWSGRYYLPGDEEGSYADSPLLLFAVAQDVKAMTACLARRIASRAGRPPFEDTKRLRAYLSTVTDNERRRPAAVEVDLCAERVADKDGSSFVKWKDGSDGRHCVLLQATFERTCQKARRAEAPNPPQ